MADFSELMRIFAIPRPSGSPGERRTQQAIRTWLKARGIPYTEHAFRLYPYFNEAVGAWLIGSRALLALAVARRWGWPTLPIAVVGLLGGTLDGWRHWPLVTWPGAQQGVNILIRCGPPAATREIFLSAHYDSKTQLLDHRQQQWLYAGLPVGAALALALGWSGPLEGALHRHPRAAALVHATALLLALPMLALAGGLGLNMLPGRLMRPSQGAVDNGAACAILLALAERLAAEPLQHVGVTIALFGGEEAGMQGSAAYLRARRRAATGRATEAIAVNLEFLGQNGAYQLFAEDGILLRPVATSPAVNALVQTVVAEVTGTRPAITGRIISDGASFLAAGIPTAVLASRDMQHGTAGMHRPSDNLARIDLNRLPETTAILERLVRRCDQPA